MALFWFIQGCKLPEQMSCGNSRAQSSHRSCGVGLSRRTHAHPVLFLCTNRKLDDSLFFYKDYKREGKLIICFSWRMQQLSVTSHSLFEAQDLFFKQIGALFPSSASHISNAQAFLLQCRKDVHFLYRFTFACYNRSVGSRVKENRCKMFQFRG